MDEDKYIRLSVQGDILVFRKEWVLSQDWLLSKIVTSQIPWEETSQGQIYLDCDWASFRIISSIMKHTVDLAQITQKLSLMDLALLQTTARYLLVESIADQLEGVKVGFMAELETKDCEIRTLREKADKYDELHQDLKGHTITRVRCNAYVAGFAAAGHWFAGD